MIKWFSDITVNDFNLAGGKGYNLSQMFNYSINVPNGFVVTSVAYDSYVNKNHISQKIDNILSSNSSNEEKSRTIKLLFDVQTFPEDLKRQILSEMTNKTSGRVAVRSSSTLEDLPGISFAGQYSSYLNVEAPDLIEKVVLCWQSLWNERAIEYRAKFNLTTKFTHSVIIQEMINSKLSGVIFTSNPINGIRNEMLINASYGLGEAVVSGEVNADQYIVNKKSGKMMKEEIASKEKLCQYSSNGIEYVPVDNSIKSISCLRENHIKAIVIAVAKIQDYFGKPQDIEFAFDENDVLFIVQSRDITTLFPIEALEHDGKLRAYFSAGTVLLGMKEPFTPLGFDIFSRMFPTIINVMTMPKKPINNSFVKYTGNRMYVDITYLLSSRFVSKQFANGLAANDLPFKDVLDIVIDKHGSTFRKQGIKFKIPYGVLKYGLSMVGDALRVNKMPREKRYDTMIKIGEDIYHDYLKKSKNLNTVEEKIEFTHNCMDEAFVLTQKQAIYATDMIVIEKIKKQLNKMYGERYNLEQLIYSLPRCVTRELIIKMNLAAKYFDENSLKPTAEHPKIKIDILNRFGHRGNTELDFGTQRWSEDPGFIINQVKSYMVDKMYERNLAEINEKSKIAEALIEEIYQTVKEDRGENKANKLKKKMINYRIAAGMREYPKYCIVRMLGIARNVMLEVGEDFRIKGLIDDKGDIFFLVIEDILSKENLKEKIKINKVAYKKEMLRTSIPRVVINTGETYYSA